MAHTKPDAAALKARYPAFSAVDNAVIDAVLLEADAVVDTTWLEIDYAPAILAYVAHVLTCEGHGSHPEAQIASMGDFQRFKLEDISLDRGSEGMKAHADLGPLGKTSFGRRFLEFRHRNVPAVATC